MIILGREELARLDPRNNWRRKDMRLAQLRNIRRRHSPLLGILRKDRRAIARADIVALAIERCRVMDAKENFQQLLKTDGRRIVFQLADFGVIRRSAANLLVRRVGWIATGVAGNNRLDSSQLLEDGFQAPETSTAESR